MHPFEKLGLGKTPLFLAPLAGVSDSPFRRICAMSGADLTYVEMLSATALNYRNKRTIEMLYRHSSENKVGVQVTSKTPQDMGHAVAFLDTFPFETIDINMGCSVRKIVGSGCGAAILRDPERVYATTAAARRNTSKPLSVKIRLGWSHSELNYAEVVAAAQQGGAEWITVHGRTRSDTYSNPVSLDHIAKVVECARVPIVGNGNLFTASDAHLMMQTGVSGLMISRGALGNPWLFREIKGHTQPVTLPEWRDAVLNHLEWQSETFQNSALSAVCMRKHLLWYVSGFPGSRKLRDTIVHCSSLPEAKEHMNAFASELAKAGVVSRSAVAFSQNERFNWDPKYEMDRAHDSGVGHEELA